MHFNCGTALALRAVVFWPARTVRADTLDSRTAFLGTRLGLVTLAERTVSLSSRHRSSNVVRGSMYMMAVGMSSAFGLELDDCASHRKTQAGV